MPGAFTGTCSAHVPGYINTYDQFKAKGITDVYIVTVNDVFTLKSAPLPLSSVIDSIDTRLS